MACVTDCIASPIYPNFDSLFRCLSWRAATFRRQVAYKVLDSSVEVAQPFLAFSTRYLTWPRLMRATGWNFREVDFLGACELAKALPCCLLLNIHWVKNLSPWHDLVETYIEASGIAWTHLHPNVISDSLRVFFI
jgi:hypothetical protein